MSPTLLRSIFLPAAFLLLLAVVLRAADLPIATKIEMASNDHKRAIDAADREYRKAFGEALAKAAKIEVFLLDTEMTKVEKAGKGDLWLGNLPFDQFPIIPYGKVSRILKRKSLAADEINLLMPALQSTIAVENTSGGAFCHSPVHGVRVWSDGRIVFQSSFCYHCMNFYFIYPDGGAKWTAIKDDHLQEVMEVLMPIPQAVKDRFEGRKPEKATK